MISSSKKTCITDTPIKVQMTVNGKPCSVEVEPRRTLADVLRREAGLTGVRIGCEIGSCGTCTVLINSEPVRSCVMLAAQADSATIETVESLAIDSILSPLQQAFSDHHALQCGFCTPGFLMLATALLRKEPAASRQRIREYLSANLCRCTGYSSIIDAVESVTCPLQQVQNSSQIFEDDHSPRAN